MKKIICFLAFFVICFMLSSCGGGGGNEELYLSEPIPLEDGSGTKYILYNYYGDKVGEFVVPAPIKGEDGKEGNGIDDISGKPNPDGSNTTLITIVYTDKEIGNDEITIPNGVSVVDATPCENEEGEPCFILVFSDGSTSEKPIPLPKGKDGVGIESFKFGYDPDLDKIVIDVKFTGDELEDFYDELEPPKDGNGIEYMKPGDPAIEVVDGKEKYVILVKYTDSEKPEKFYLDKPLDPNRWYTSSDYKSEDNILDARHGDFYFDTQNKLIKLYEDGEWRTIVSFKTEDNLYSVTFDLNADLKHPATMPTGWKEYYPSIKSGTYGIGSAGIPIPSRPGYEFVGWCTKEEVTPTSAFFTDLTPVFNDLTLYAIWEIKDFTITFDTDGGTPMESITQTFDSPLTTPKLPEKDGYDFAGYYYKDELIEFPEKMPSMDITLKVKWEPKEYTITFITNCDTVIDPITLAYGAKIVAPSNPIKEGYTFVGWDIEIPETMPIGGLTITAIWEKNI